MLFRVKHRLEALEEDLHRLERNFQALELEWSNVYDKIRKVMGRIVKSRAILEAKEDGDEQAVTPALSSPGGTHPGLLSPRQKQIQQEILRRRAGGS